MAKEKKNLKLNCKDFELDLTDYITGDTTFLTKEKQNKLFAHLRTCQECQKQLWSWKETMAVLVGRKQSERLDTLFEQFSAEGGSASGGKSESAEGIQPTPPKASLAKGGETVINAKWEIGSAAGKIYQVLKQNGKTPIPVIRQKTGLLDYPFYEAIGWLAKEEKVILTKDARPGVTSGRGLQKATKTAYIAEAR